jgi:anti-anti-sigma regulatory factor
MPQDSLRIEDQPGTQAGRRILRLNGALVMTTMFEFQATVRADQSRSLIIDFTNVPYVDSAGIGGSLRHAAAWRAKPRAGGRK